MSSLKEETQRIMNKYSIVPSKDLGQNFLIDEYPVKLMLDSLDLKEGELVLEIGPGLGALTRSLLERKVILEAFEIDRNLELILKNEFGSYPNFTLHMEDFLKANLDAYSGKNLKVVSNLPYYILTKIIEKILASSLRLSAFAFMVEDGVKERLLAPIKDNSYGALNVLIYAYSKPKLVTNVSRGAFVPQPNISSAIYLVENKNGVVIEQKFYHFVKRLFLNRRKTMLNNLMALGYKKEYIIDVFTKLHFSLTQRAQELDTKSFELLYAELSTPSLSQ